MVDRWEKVDSELLGDYRIFQLRAERSRSPHTGQEHTFFVLNSPDWINVVAQTREGKVLLIRQYRHGIEEVALEIPGGMVDAGETPADAARRELREETGYEAEAMIPIGRVTPNPAFLDNCCHTFLATAVKRVGTPAFDHTEYIETEFADLKEIPRLISTGRITHALVVAAFYHLQRFLDEQEPDAPGNQAASAR